MTENSPADGQLAETILQAPSDSQAPTLDQPKVWTSLQDALPAAGLGPVGRSTVDQDAAATVVQQEIGSRGRFRIVRPHAQGGLGQVSVALDQELNREVALKEILPRHADDPASRERFVLEAEITGGLEHPGIVPVYALGQTPDGRPFYAMRFIKGDSLKTAVEAYHHPDNPNRRDIGSRRVELRKLLGRFNDVCNAMEYAHNRGVLHRDLKPANIMVGKYGETLVVDWGLAKAIGRREVASEEASLSPATALSSSGLTQPGSAVGTPAYMSPEQARGELDQLGPASDVYSLGATLYHILCGRPPFEKEQVLEILKKVQHGQFPRPRSVAQDVPAALETICLKAMALNPADRYPSARSLADDLEHWLADEPIAAAPDTFGDRVNRFARKHRGYVRAGAIGLVLIAIVSTVAAIQINSSRSAAVVLAGKNERLAASESAAKTKAQDLAARNEQLAETQTQLASKNAQLAKDEKQSRLATERQLKFATAERLAALSQAKRSESPELSLLFAVESGRATQRDGLGLLPNSHQALLDSLLGIGGRPLIGHQESVNNVAISPDSHWLVSGSTNGTIRVWDLTAENPGVNPRSLPGLHRGNDVMTISPDGRWLVMCDYTGVAHVWDLSKRDIAGSVFALSGHQRGINAVAVSPNGRWLVTGGADKTARIWDLSAAKPAAAPRVLTGHQDEINCLAICPDSRLLVTGGSGDRTARVWDLTAENPASTVRILNGTEFEYMRCVAFSPDRRWIVTSGDPWVRLWDRTAVDLAKNPRILKGHQRMVLAVAISPNSRWLVSAGSDATARLWDLSGGNPGNDSRLLSGHEGRIYKVAISADSRWAVTASNDKSARVWDLNAANPTETSRVLRGHQSEIYAMAISADSRWVVTGGMVYPRIWSLPSDHPAVNPRLLYDVEYVSCMAITPDRRTLVTPLGGGAQVWNLTAGGASKERFKLMGHTYAPGDIAITSDGRWVVTASEDMTARVWDLAGKDPNAKPVVLSGHSAGIGDVEITPDGRSVVTASNDKTARVWDLTAKDPSANPRVLRGHEGRVIAVAITPDGRRVVTASIDSTARV